MSTLKQIKAPISDEIAQFNKEFISNIKTEKGLLDKILRYIIRRKGKQIRPILVLLSAKLVGKISERTFTAATLIELLHTATLVHDDVVDNSNIRRGFFSVNALWKNKIAVLIGDFLVNENFIRFLRFDPAPEIKTAVLFNLPVDLAI